RSSGFAVGPGQCDPRKRARRVSPTETIPAAARSEAGAMEPWKGAARPARGPEESETRRWKTVWPPPSRKRDIERRSASVQYARMDVGRATCMEIYILRHGIAEEAHGGMKDADRALTAEGAKKLQSVLRRV